MKTLTFSFGGNLVLRRLDGEEIETEIGPDNYRALYRQNHRGEVTHITFEREETRVGKPEVWLKASLPYAVVRAIEHQIEDEYREEQRRMVESYDRAYA